MSEEILNHFCEKCNKTMNQNQFYRSNNTEKYTDNGLMNMCKRCLTMHVDNWDSNTYLWILQEIDVPYVPEEWNKILAKYGKDKKSVTGMTILGRYLSKMKLKQYKDYRWKDSDFIQQLANHKIEETMTRQGYDIQQITEVINKSVFVMPEKELEIPVYDDPPPGADTSDEDYFAQQSGIDDDDLIDNLTDEDKIMLRLKWGKGYKPYEWVSLEKLYREMMQSYDIQTAGHIDTLKMVCKTSLKANQLLDIGDKPLICVS